MMERAGLGWPWAQGRTHTCFGTPVLFVNLKTAKALGITIPEAIMVRADEVLGEFSSRDRKYRP
jgi:hypothetical protein